MSPQIRMINDIAVHFRHQGLDEAAAAVAGHVRAFWDPRMRAELIRRVDAEPEMVDPVALAAVLLLTQP
ncbi:formate dehydrogenase subunit delta [Actinoplanes subglobosus]|uniref:Formate dehydrogenase subunit delta n=1 Tax=Actinoplanes subglobosus TaxID=1547892 RepID=A0ABV8ISN7_9ACTN